MSKEHGFPGSLHINESLRYSGGAEGYILSLASALDTRGVAVRLASGRESSFVYPQLSYFIPGVHKRTERGQTDANIARVRQIMEDEGLQLVHLHNVDSPELCRALSNDYPMLRTVIDSRAVCPLEFKVHKSGAVCDFAMGPECLDCSDGSVTDSELEAKQASLDAISRLDLLVTPSSYTKSQLVTNGVPESKISVLPLFIPEQLPHPQPTEEHAADLLYVGRLVRSKGVREAIVAFSAMRKAASMTICGDGPDLPHCQRIARELGVEANIRFVGWVDPSERAKYFASSKVVVFPSTGPESFGLVGIEAMYYGKPVVAFNSGGVSEWLDNAVTGYSVDTGDTLSMSHYIEHLLNDETLRESFGLKGKEAVTKKFSFDSHMRKLSGLYNQVLANK